MPGDRARRVSQLVLATALLVWVALTLPLASGDRTLFQRDVFGLHLPLRFLGAQALQQGEIPALEPQWALGQPFRGNPNASAFYPGNLLYLVLPFWSAFNLHFALHWLLAFGAMGWLAREMGQSRLAASTCALTYAGCGAVLTCLTFYTTIAVVAWWPVCLIGGRRGGRAGVALGGIGAGMAFLAGEPVAALIGIAPLVLVSLESNPNVRRAALTCFSILAFGALIALPQAVATWRILDFTDRATGGMASSTSYVLHPFRLIELLLPLPFGVPGELGPTGYLDGIFGGREPYVLSLYFGVVGWWLALQGAANRRRWAALALLGMLTAVAGGALAPLLHAVSGGVFRYPEKFYLFGLAWSVPLLVGWGLDDLLRGGRSRHVLLHATAGLAGALALTAWMWSRPVLRWLSPGDPIASETASHWSFYWALGLALAALLLEAASLALRRGAVHWLPALQLVAMLSLGPMIQFEPTELYRQSPPFAARLPPNASISMSTVDSPFGTERPVYHLSDPSRRSFWRIGHADLDYPTGVTLGLSYPFPRDVDHMMTPLTGLVLRHLPRLDWEARVRWMRLCGLDAVTLAGAQQIRGLRRLETTDRFGVATSLYAVESPLPRAWWPDAVEAIPSQVETLRRVDRLEDARRTALIARPTDHRGGGSVSITSQRRDRIELDVESAGGVFVLRRAYNPLLVARTGTQRLESFPAYVALTAVEVPRGRHRVVLEVSNVPETIAAVIAMIALIGAFLVVSRRGSSRLAVTPGGTNAVPDSRSPSE